MPQSSGLRRNPYSSFLDLLEKPARYIGGEYFEKIKNWDQTAVHVALCFPDVYEIGMSHLGFKILHDELNKHPDILAERVFAPWGDMENELRIRNLPLVTLENFRPLKDFDVLGFSLQYEMTYTNILNMLELGGVPLLQAERAENDPFVICGGPCATHPEPLADFMDFVVIGDGEDLFVKIVRFISTARAQGKSRSTILSEMAQWQGIYVPSLYTTVIDEHSLLEVVDRPKQENVPARVRRFILPTLKDRAFPTESPIPHLTAIFDRFSVELSRGCTEGCRFCQAGMIYRPVRERRPTDVIDAVVDGLKKGGFDEASLTCLSTADYSAVTPLVLDLVDKMSEQGATLGISSLRAYGLDERVFDKLASVKNSSLTFAPEAGTERMRMVINKNISEEDMLKTAENVFSRGWGKMKLYFMIGLPTETMDDVKGIMDTGHKALKVAREKCGVRKAEITISVSTFVPKPHTPFQWAAMIGLEEIKTKQEFLFKAAKDYRLNFRKHFSKTSVIEGIVSRGDRRIGRVIYKAFKKGARFDGWDECFNYDQWIDTIEQEQIDPGLYLGSLPILGRLPWSHIDVGLEDKFLETEWKKALKDSLSPPCGKIHKMHVHHNNLDALSKDFDLDKKKLVCYSCGVACDLKAMVEERRDYLTDLKAFKSSDEYVKPDRGNKRREMETQPLIGGISYRIKFSKIGPISFIGHLDLLKVVARIFKRADIEVCQSQGFHKRPLISFGPALTLGISSLCEFFDVRVPQGWDDPEVILDKLRNNSERGLLFHSSSLIEVSAPSIQDMTEAFTYFIPVENGGPEQLNEKLEKLLAQTEIFVKTFSPKKGVYVEKDIRPRLLTVKWGDLQLAPEVLNAIDEVSPVKEKYGLWVVAKVEGGSSIKPSELQASFSQFGMELGKPVKVEVTLS